MEILSAPQLAPIFEAQDFAAMLQAVSDTLSILLGNEGANVDNSLILFESDTLASGWIFNSATVHKRRHFRPYRLNAQAFKGIWSPAQVVVHAQAPAQLLSAEDHPVPVLSDSLAGTILVPVVVERRVGALVLGVTEAGCALDPAARDGLLAVGAALGRVAPRMLQYERMECQTQQIHHLHESMLKVMISLDKSSLLSTLIAILSRQFGFTRLLIAQVHPETQDLRSELHSGFSSTFAPFTIPMEDTQNLFVCVLNRGEVLVAEGDQEFASEELPPFILEAPTERRIFLPLKIGHKPIGLIYADQANQDGAPLFKPVLEIFAHQAAAALENLNLRVRAEQRAETDALTGLYNRYFLDKALEIEIPRVKRYNHPISLLMIDLCDFKRVNDTYGHQFGDYILRETGSLIQANVRRPDIVVRYGGDEFVVLMVNTSQEQATLVRSRIEQAFIERNRMQSDERTTIKISLGLRSADAQTIESLLYEADMEMYAHKARQMRNQLIQALIGGNVEKIELANRIVGSLCNILYKKAPYYPDHARRVAHMALNLARRLGLPTEEVAILTLAALLHDVGKVSIPTEILQKVEPLTQGEIAAMRHHPAFGEEFFQGIEYLEPVRPIIRAHHERYDGQTTGEYPGYPEGLHGERIPLGARILKLAESADCMLSGRTYRPAKPPEVVTQILREESGHSFDPRLVNILLADRDWYEGLGEPERMAELLIVE